MRDDTVHTSGTENNPGANPWGERVLAGTPVYDANGAFIGHVSDRGFERGGLIVRKDGIFPRDVTIPTSAIRQSDANSVTLAVTQDQLDALVHQSAPNQPSNEPVPSPQQARATDAGEMPPDLDTAIPPGVGSNPDTDADTGTDNPPADPSRDTPSEL